MKISNAMIVLLMMLVCMPSVGEEFKPIPRRIPPMGKPLAEKDRVGIEKHLKELGDIVEQLSKRSAAVYYQNSADVEVFHKAVRFALELGEFYKPGDVAKAHRLLDEGIKRGKALLKGETPWLNKSGLVVRGYRSVIDDSVQPYGLVIPEDMDRAKLRKEKKMVPVYVWLHGRGDSNTDMHFIDQRMKSKGQISPKGAIVIHPFGRHCIGFKSAGEVDVLESLKHAKEYYPIDGDKQVLMGFSMGGAGVWHIGAHYPQQWVGISPGAGFAETKEYTKLKQEDYPPVYEQTLWGVYDVPNYVRNMFDVPTVVYSGEVDKQIQAARVMERAFKENGKVLPHVIGKKMGHKYSKEGLAEVLAAMDKAVKSNEVPREIHFQTRTLRYAMSRYIFALRLKEHWEDSRVDAKVTSKNTVEITTKNMVYFFISPKWLIANMGENFRSNLKIIIDGQELGFVNNGPLIMFYRPNGTDKWVQGELKHIKKETHGGKKIPRMQGPMDDVLMDKFFVVVPTGKYAEGEEKVKAWVDFELEHFKQRWKALYRGELQIIKDVDVTDKMIEANHLILWGTPSSNKVMGRLFEGEGVKDADRFGGITWRDGKIIVGEKVYDGRGHVLMGINHHLSLLKNTQSRGKYIAINTGPTHREAHDRTNSLQNPKLPDYAVIDLSEAPSDKAPGKVVDAGFFDEEWKLKK